MSAIERDAVRLANLAFSSKNSRDVISRWLAQDLNVRDAAVAIIALELVTGEFFTHPDTAQPTLEQIASRPKVWGDAVQLVLTLRNQVAIPESQAPSCGRAWSAGNGVNKTHFDRKRASSKPNIRFVPPKQRGTSCKMWSAN